MNVPVFMGTCPLARLSLALRTFKSTSHLMADGPEWTIFPMMGPESIQLTWHSMHDAAWFFGR